jgi:hypothetical protein
MNYPRIGTYSSLRGDGAPLLNHPERIDALAKWDDVIIELGTLHEHPDIAAKLRAANPAIRLHAYVVMVYGDWPAPFFQDFKRVVTSTNGVLLGTNGQPWSFSNVNVARGETMNALADLILRYMQSSNIWSGAFVDILIPALNGQNDIGWQRMGYASQAEFESQWNANAPAFVTKLKSSGLPVATNYGNGFPGHANGNMIESAFRLNGGTWETNMVQNGPKPGLLKLSWADPASPWICSEPAFHEPPDSPTNARLARYHDASACLAGGFGSFGRYEGNTQWCIDRLGFWQPYYSHPQRGKYWLGNPITEVRHVTAYHNKTVDLWERYFEHGVAVVNPSGSPHSIGLPGRYRPINGVAKTAWSIPPHDAMLLEAV